MPGQVLRKKERKRSCRSSGCYNSRTEYKGYFGKVKFDDEASLFQCEVVNTRDLITFHGTSVAELRKAFCESVDDYLVAFCAERGEEPDVVNR